MCGAYSNYNELMCCDATCVVPIVIIMSSCVVMQDVVPIVIIMSSCVVMQGVCL